ncbi:AraC family transcriptional regulator, partial [Bacillus sp. D-CC]
MNNSIDIQHLCDLVHSTFHVPVQFLSTDRKIVYESTSHTIGSPFYSSKEEHLNEIFQENAPCNFPIFKGNKYLENFISSHITKHEHIKGTIIIGPTTYPKVSDEMAIKLMKYFNCTNNMQQGVDYYQFLPEIKKSTLIDIS